MIRTLLRLPSPKWENELATGIESVDAYLRRIDSGLVGAKSVRRLTLLEAKDFLLEAAEHASTEQQEQAIDAATKTFGDPDDLARHQRSERYRMFRRSALSFGLSFAVLMFIINYFGGLMTEASWFGIIGMFVFHAVFFGTFMGLWMTFCFAQSLPVSDQATEQADAFVVFYPRSSIVAAWLLIVGFSIYSLMAILGFAGIGLFGAGNVFFNLMLLALGLWLVITAAACLCFKIHVTESDFVIQSWRGLTRISFNQVSSFTQASEWYMVFALVMGRAFRLQWLDEKGREKSMIVGLNGELKNADRFQALLDQALESRKQYTGAELKGAP